MYHKTVLYPRGYLKRFYLLAFITGLLTTCIDSEVFAQSGSTIYEIMMSGDYRYGEGYGADREDARRNAKQEFIQKIEVFISSEVEVTETERGNQYSSLYVGSVRTVSRMQLRGLQFFDEERRNGSWRSIAYMSNTDFENTIESDRRRLYSNIRQAMQNDSLKNYNRSAWLYYDILQSTYAVPVPLYTDQELHGATIEIRQFARDKLYHWLNGIELRLSNVRNNSSGENVEIYFHLNATYQHMPAEYIEISLNQPGYGWHAVENGRAEIFYDLKPEKVSEPIHFRVRFAFPSSEYDDLRSIVERTLPPRNRSLDVNFRNIINPDFDINQLSENRFQFVPKPGMLTVTDLEWDFGDGTQSNNPNPVHRYASDSADKVVTLTFNRSPDLKISKPLQSIDRTPQSGISDRSADRNQLADEPGYFLPIHHRNVIDRISRLDSFSKLRDYLTFLKSNNSIVDWSGRRQEISLTEQNRGYMVIINPETEQIHAVMSPVTNGHRFNLLSESTERLSAFQWEDHFRGMGVIWFRFSR